MRESIRGKVTNVRWVQGHFEWEKHWIMTVQVADGNRLEGTIPRGANVKPGDHIQFDAAVDHRTNTYKRPTRFRHDTQSGSGKAN